MQVMRALLNTIPRLAEPEVVMRLSLKRRALSTNEKLVPPCHCAFWSKRTKETEFSSLGQNQTYMYIQSADISGPTVVNVHDRRYASAVLKR